MVPKFCSSHNKNPSQSVLIISTLATFQILLFTACSLNEGWKGIISYIVIKILKQNKKHYSTQLEQHLVSVERTTWIMWSKITLVSI